MKKRILVFMLLAPVSLLMLAQGPASKDKTAAKSAAVPPAVTIPLPPDWTTPVNISKQGGSSELPSIAVDNAGKAYATWTEWFGGVGAPRAMMFNTNISGQWPDSQGRLLFYPNIDDVGFPSIACHPTNETAWIACHDGDFSAMKMGIMFREYVHGTLTYERFIPGVGGASSYVTLAYNPADNMVYAVFMDDVSDTVTFEFAIFIWNPATRSWDGGNLIGGATGDSRYWPNLTFDRNGTAHLVYISRPPAQVWYLKNPTPQNVNTWTAPVNISGDTARDWSAPRIAADKDGDVYVVWYANTGGYESATEEVLFRKTVAGVWQAPENLSNSPDRSEGATIDVNPDTKDVYVAFQELVGGTNWEVYFRTYASPPSGGPKVWSSIVNMTNNPAHSGEPFLKRDPMGGLHLVYHDVIDGNMEIMYTSKPGKPSTSITVTSPNGGESWEALTLHNITWTTQGTVENVRIELSTDGGATITDIVSSTSNTGSYSWTVPNTPSSNCWVRVSDASNDNIADVSDAAFTIAPPPTPKAPLGPAIDTRLDSTETKKINKVTWQANPENAAIPLKSYKIYRKVENGSFSLLTSVSPATLLLEDTNLDIKTKYSYYITALSLADKESDPSGTVTESKKFEFPPLNPTITTTVNRILFYREKNNTISFEKNAFNDDNAVNGYRIYRKKATDDDDQFVAIKTLDSSTFSYKDARLPVNPKYAYAVTTVYKDGRESRNSATVTEK